jgi:murein DD-endopeptidase MepM/ murein hydrolase activator NlpD
VKRLNWRRLFATATATVVATFGLVATASPALAAETADWLPFKVSSGVVEIGCTWNNGCDGGYHNGTLGPAIDFIVDIGTPVYAAGPGTVIGANGSCAKSGAGICDDRGRYVEIAHPDGRHSRYLHLSSVSRSSGDVARGELIGYSGDYMANGVPHLHYDETVNGSKVDPGTMYAVQNSQVVQYPGVLNSTWTSWTQVPAWSDKWAWSEASSSGGVLGNNSVVFINGGGETWANANPVANPWTKLSNSTNAISASGSYVAFIDGCGAAWATSNLASVPATQLTPCSGAIAIAIGSKGNVVFVDGCGSAHGSYNYTNSSSWVTLTSCGGTAAIAAGGGGPSGVVAVISSCGALNATLDFVNWTAITGCNGAGGIGIGPDGTLAFAGGCGQLNASRDYRFPAQWVNITGCGGASKFAVGTGKSLVFADGCGSAHGTMTFDNAQSWVVLNGCGDTQALGMGTNGETGVINGCGSLNVTANFQSWLNITPCSGAQKVAIG